MGAHCFSGALVMLLVGDLQKDYAVCVCILIFKMFFVAFLTAAKRFQTKSFSNPEDNGRKNVKSDDRVERVRRVHLNDLENIPLFIFAGFLFLSTNPGASGAYYFYVFTAARVLHTISYLLALQPFRAIFFFVGVVDTVAMCVQVMMHALA